MLGTREIDPTITFEGAGPVLGSKFWENLGMTINADSGLLDPKRNRNVSCECEE